MSNDDVYRIMAMSPKQAIRERKKLEKLKEAEFNRQKPAETGRKNTGENKNDTQITNDVTP